MKLLFNRPVLRRAPDPEQLTLFQEVTNIETWLRGLAEKWASEDKAKAARLERGADRVEKRANEIRERMER